MKNRCTVLAMVALSLSLLVATGATAQLVELGDDVNLWLEAQGHDFRLAQAELLTASHEAGITVFFNNRAKQLGSDFVPGDPRRGGSTAIFWISDATDGVATNLDFDQTQTSIDDAMTTWQDVSCSNLPLVPVAPPPFDLGVVEFIFTGGAQGSPFAFVDLTHAGFGSIDFALGANTLGVTFTFVFVDGNGPTDVNNDGKADTAFREIYYNNRFIWQADGVSNIDLETVALHEAGHGLSQGHFGALFRTDANGAFHFAPRAVMNAGYTGPQRGLAGTDNGGHCSIWGEWPNN